MIGRALSLVLRGHRELVLQNLALRQQLTALKRTTKRPPLQTRDRLFGSPTPGSGRTGAQHWSLCSRTPSCGGIAIGSAAVGCDVRDPTRRPSTNRSQRIRLLNPLRGAPRIHGKLRVLGVDVSDGRCRVS